MIQNKFKQRAFLNKMQQTVFLTMLTLLFSGFVDVLKIPLLLAGHVLLFSQC